MTIFQTIVADLLRINETHVQQTATSLDPAEEGETVLVVVQSLHAKVLWALAHDYDRQGMLAQHSLKFDANGEEDRKALRILISRLAALEEIARNLAWAEMREEAAAVGGWDNSVGLRENFTLVISKNAAPQITFTDIPIPGELLRSLMRLRRAANPEDPPKGKPQ
jgi:hypothetical protein